MKSLYSFIIKPKEERYDNIRKVDDKTLIINTNIEDHRFVSKKAVVVSTPAAFETSINKGDEVYVHHNVFRRWYDIRGKEKNSSAFINENEYFVSPEEIFAYKNNDNWKCFDKFCFVKPLKDVSKWSVLKEKKLLGKLVYSNEYLNELGIACGDVVGFTPDSEYEFNIENQKLYRILSNQITYVKNTKSN